LFGSIVLILKLILTSARVKSEKKKLPTHENKVKMSTDFVSNEYEQKIRERQCWECDLILDVGAPSSSNVAAAPSVVNLSQFFRDGKIYEFPSHFDGPDHEHHLVQSLQLACIKGGFQLKTRTSKKKVEDLQESTNSKFGRYIVLACKAHDVYRKNKGLKQRKRKTSTSKPLSKKDACPFTCILSMRKVDDPQFPGRWTLKANRNGCWHKGHFRMQPGELAVSIKNMTEDEKKLASQCAEVSFTAASSTALINVRNTSGINFNEEQIRYLTAKENEYVRNLSDDASSADRLISSFQRRKDVAFLAVTFSPTEGLMLSGMNCPQN